MGDQNACLPIEKYDQCRLQPKQERNDCKPKWNKNIPKPKGFPESFRTCYKNKKSKTCYTFDEWKMSAEVTACAIRNQENPEPKNKWWQKLDETAIMITLVGLILLAVLFVAGFYG